MAENFDGIREKLSMFDSRFGKDFRKYHANDRNGRDGSQRVFWRLFIDRFFSQGVYFFNQTFRCVFNEKTCADCR